VFTELTSHLWTPLLRLPCSKQLIYGIGRIVVYGHQPCGLSIYILHFSADSQCPTLALLVFSSFLAQLYRGHRQE
jgi:hypothetical protein